MSKAERLAEIARLREEHRAVLATPLMSEGSLSPSQLGMMSDRGRKRWQAAAMLRMRVEAEIRRLERSDEEIAAADARRAEEGRLSRIAGLRARIAALRHLGQGKRGLRPTYARAIAQAEAELATLVEAGT